MGVVRAVDVRTMPYSALDVRILLESAVDVRILPEEPLLQGRGCYGS